jgi:hypothetical protein
LGHICLRMTIFIFTFHFIEEVIEEHGLKLLVYRPESQEIALWKD